MKFSGIHLLHGKGGSPAGSVSKLQAVLQPLHPNLSFVRPLLPHTDPRSLAQDSVVFLKSLEIPSDCLVVGISLGGLVAAKLQEESRPELAVICISSPTWADQVRLEMKPVHRVAIYSSKDEVIAGRTSEWPSLAEAHDFEWLTHDTDRHRDQLVGMISNYISGKTIA